MATHRPPRKIGPQDRGQRLSALEFEESEFEGPWRYEREQGRLVVLSPEGQRHLDDSRPWRLRLSRYWLDHPDRVDDVVVQAWVRVAEGTDRIGDLGVYLHGSSHRGEIPDRVPDLMFEFVSPGTEAHERNYVLKRKEYMSLGVLEYVIVDRQAASVTVVTQAVGHEHARALGLDDTYESHLLPGLRIALSEVL